MHSFTFMFPVFLPLRFSITQHETGAKHARSLNTPNLETTKDYPMPAKSTKAPWTKPALEVVPIKSAKAGSFHTTDTKHTHRST